MKTIKIIGFVVVVGMLLLLRYEYDWLDMRFREQAYISVTIQGAVEQEGSFEVPFGATLQAVVDMAILKENASTALNLKQPVHHNDFIIIPFQSEKPLISLNFATLEELVELPGIGPTSAQRIIEYRETVGLFQTIEEVMKVKGIKEKLFEKIKDYITL